VYLSLATMPPQTPTPMGPPAGLLAVMSLIWLAVIVLVIVSNWRVFTKAGQPGWACLIPFYNIYVMLKIVGRPGWWLVLCLIPFVNLVVAIILTLDLARSFGKSAVFGFFGLFLFGIIGWPILAFGSARYVGPAAGGQGNPVPATA